MRSHFYYCWIALWCFLVAPAALAQTCDDEAATVVSPKQKIELKFCLVAKAPMYSVRFEGQPVLELSRLGLYIKGQPALAGGFTVAKISRSETRGSWEQVWGEEHVIRDDHNEMRVALQSGDRKLDMVFRVFDDGVGFRYEVPKQKGLKKFEIKREVTEFKFSENGQAWWIPAFHDKTYELLYKKNPISELTVVHTPLTIEMKNYVVSVHEAAVMDYPTIALRGSGSTRLVSELTPWADGSGAKVKTPLVTPWRTLQITRTAGELITSYLNLNLNEPSKLPDTSWIKPMKYMGIWWALHTGRGSWAAKYPDLAATTENSIRQLDLTRALGIPALLIEGWNKGWEDEPFSYTKSNPHFDLPAVAAHAKKIGVQLVGHHETNGAIKNYEAQMEKAFALYQSLGVHAVKTGYVGTRVEGGEFHYGQLMVRHSQKVVERAAAHQIMIDVHEPVKDTGLRRTYPNLMTREGVRGMEYDAWSDANGNPPSHTAILPFTRGLSGPIDFTPGIFDLLMGGKRGENRVRTTLAKQLALYVVLYSPLQMAADLPEFYAGHPAFQFIKDVPVDWQTTQVPHAKIGEYVTIVRQDRHSKDWYVGSLTNESRRNLSLKLDFLDNKKSYCAEIYRDQPATDWQTNPLTYEIKKVKVKAGATISLKLAPGGGQAMRIRESDLKNSCG